MADGNWTYWGACAVYTPEFPFGTVIALYNPDGSFNRQCTAEDTGGAVGYGHIDLAMPGDEAAAVNWGVRYLPAQVLRWGWGNGQSPQFAATPQPATPQPTATLRPVVLESVVIPKPKPKPAPPGLVIHCRMTPFAHCHFNGHTFQ
jgi:hypothetical protein